MMTETLTTEQVEEILALAASATPVEPRDLMAYDHGGGRLAVIRDGERDLIADFYGDGADRDYYAALAPQTVSSLATELLALRKRVEELEGALLPFVRIADMEERAEPFDSVMVNVDRCRDARTVYNAIHTNEVIEGADFGGDEEDSVPPATPKEPS